MNSPDTTSKQFEQAMNQLRTGFEPLVQVLNPEIEPATIYVLRPFPQEPGR